MDYHKLIEEDSEAIRDIATHIGSMQAYWKKWPEGDTTDAWLQAVEGHIQGIRWAKRQIAREAQEA